MQKKLRYFKCKDYTVKEKLIDGQMRYYLQFHTQVDAPIVEINLEYFNAYYGEFKRVLERQRDEKRRHIDDDGLDGSLGTTPFEQRSLAKVDIEAVLKTCTENQRRRFTLYHIEGYSFAEIARMGDLDDETVRRSVLAVRKKIKIFFGG